jgi:hypothetical protein
MSLFALPQLSSGDSSASLRLLLLEENQSDVDRILGELHRTGISATATVITAKSGFEAAIAAEQFSAILAS